MKLFKLLVLAVFALACGAAEGGEYTDESFEDELDLVEEMELGKTEQAVSIRPGYGVITSSANRATPCAIVPGNGGSQVCSIGPLNKLISFRCGNGFSASELTLCQTLVDQEVSALNSQYAGSGWQIGRVTAGGTVVISRAGLAGASTTSILPYLSLTAANAGSLFESTPLQGAWNQYTSMAVGVDWAKVDSTFSNANDRLRVKGHTIGAVASFAVGLGVTTQHTDRKNSRSITAGTAKQVNHSTADRCRVNNYSTAAGALQVGPAC